MSDAQKLMQNQGKKIELQIEKWRLEEEVKKAEAAKASDNSKGANRSPARQIY